MFSLLFQNDGDEVCESINLVVRKSTMKTRGFGAVTLLGSAWKGTGDLNQSGFKFLTGLIHNYCWYKKANFFSQ